MTGQAVVWHDTEDASEVWENEAKGFDVDLALHSSNDAWPGAFDCAAAVSSASGAACLGNAPPAPPPAQSPS